MHTRTLIGELHDHIDKEVAVSGYIDVRRDHGKLVFLDIRDRSGVVQAVALPNNKEVVEGAQELRHEYTVTVRAKVNKRPEKMVNAEQTNGDIELELLEISVLGRSQELPFEQDAELNLDTLLDYRPLTLRRKRERAIFKVQHHILQAYRTALIERDFVEFEAPKIVGGDAEGGAGVFRLEYFKDRFAYLATSPQLYKQMMVGVYERIFSIGNVFRAELHSTSRHLNEYTSLDAEFGFIKDHTDVMAMLEHTIRVIVHHAEATCEKELSLLSVSLPSLPEGNFPQMKLRDALALIASETGEDCKDEPDLSPEHERWLCDYAKKKYGSDVFFVTHYPVAKRPFYTFEDEDDPGYTKSFDLLLRGVEITTGGQRVHDYDMLVKKLEEKKLAPDSFAFYLMAFRYGMPPHGGWGMGLERLTEKLLGLDNVKEATLFPREINRIDMLLSS